MENDTYKEIKENLINKILVILSIVAFPAVISSVLRIIDIGWKSTFYIHIGIIPVLLLFTIYRKSISLNLKTLFLIFLCFILSIFSFFDYSLSGSGVQYLMLAVLTAVVFTGKKLGKFIYVLAIIIISIVGVLAINGRILPQIDTITYNSNYTSWINVIVDFSLVIGLMIIVLGSIGELLNTKLSELKIANEELQKALGEIKTLQGILPICASCKDIKDDKGYWHQVDDYISKHSDAVFSHGLCEDCSDDLYGKEDWYKKTKKKK